MAVFDPTEQRMCVRVVYDGAASAGKTTNIRQLGTLFATQRTTEVISPAELRGRTLFFDWMQIAAGSVCGFPLICQVVSVPGQAAFNARRRELLATADVVVFVCDSSPRGIEIGLDSLLLADELVLPTGEPLPVVIQANKQDQLDAVDGKTLIAKARRTNVHVIEAIATEGIGVVDTFVSAVRVAARAIQSRVEAGGTSLRLPVSRVEDEHQLLARLAGIPIDREGAAELFLEEAAAAYDLLDDMPGLAAPATIDVAAPPAAASAAEDGESPHDKPTVRVARLPNAADVPTGFVWPAHTGRTLLRTLDLTDTIAVGARGAKHEVLDHVLTTSLAHHFDDPETARQALVRAARERTQLESLLVSDTVLVVQPSAIVATAPAAPSYWLWTIAPRTQDIAEVIASNPRARLDQLAAAIVDAAATTLGRGLAFTPSVRAFGGQQGAIRYAGDLETTEDPAASALALLFGALDDIAAMGFDVLAFAALLGKRLRDKLRAEDLATLARHCAAFALPNESSPVARSRVVDALQSGPPVATAAA